MPGGKWTTYDWGVRSACVMKWPESYQAKFETNALSQYCDILPTLIDAAGGKVPKSLDGKSLLPLIKGKTKRHRERAYFVFNNRDDRKKAPPFLITRRDGWTIQTDLESDAREYVRHRRGQWHRFWQAQ